MDVCKLFVIIFPSRKFKIIRSDLDLSATILISFNICTVRYVLIGLVLVHCHIEIHTACNLEYTSIDCIVCSIPVDIHSSKAA